MKSASPKPVLLLTLGSALLAGGVSAADGGPATVLYLDRTVEVGETLADPTDLWIPAAELPRVNDFELKPEGVCLDDLCIPVNQEADSEIVIERNGIRWLSLTALAGKLGQAWAAEGAQRVWSFGPIPAVRANFLSSAEAPDFVLPDRDGNPVRLSDFRGKKVLLLTWASW